VGITDAFNFIAGMDGPAAGFGVICSLFLCVMAFQRDHAFVGWYAVPMLGSCLGFVPYNFRKHEPVTIFPGDAGSTFIGFTIAYLAIKGEWSKGDHIVSFSALVLIFSVLIFDMFRSAIRRIYTRGVRSFHSWIAYVRNDHTYHRMAELFGSQKKGAIFIYAMT